MFFPQLLAHFKRSNRFDPPDERGSAGSNPLKSWTEEERVCECKTEMQKLNVNIRMWRTNGALATW